MKLSMKDIIQTALPLVLICIIVAGALGLTNELTKTPIAELQAAAELAARQEVLPEAVTFAELQEAEAEFSPYLAKDKNGNIIGYVFTTTGSGYGGKLKVMTGITLEGQVTGVSILSQNETVGLGANCTKESFRSKFEGEMPQNGYQVYKKGAPVPDGGIEAMTSATISTRAVVNAVNTALDIYRTMNMAKGGK